MPRIFKQLFFGTVYLLIIFGIGYGIYNSNRIQPTCSDGIQNQSEQGVDCGVVCGNLCAPTILPLEVTKTKLLQEKDLSSDFVALIHNPDALYGSGMVQYEINYQDDSGQVLKSEEGTAYISPNQDKYITRLNLDLPKTVSTGVLTIKAVDWSRVDPSAPPVDFIVKKESFSSTTTSAYNAVLLNNSDFDFSNVDVAVILLNDSGEIIGINSTNMQTVLGHTERAFSVTWGFSITPKPQVVVQGTTNIFANDNYLRRYGTQEKFQQYF